MTHDPGWIAFTAERPNISPILATHISRGDPWESVLDDNELRKAVPKHNLDVSEAAPFAHVEVLTVDVQPFGIRLFHDEGRGRELSRHEYEQLFESGYWVGLEEFLREQAPFTGAFLVNGGTGEVIA